MILDVYTFYALGALKTESYFHVDWLLSMVLVGMDVYGYIETSNYLKQNTVFLLCNCLRNNVEL